VDLAALGRQSATSGRLSNPSLACGEQPAGIDPSHGRSTISNAASEAPIGAECVRCGSRSECESFRAVILAKLEAGLSSQRIYQDLVAEHGFAGKYWSVRRFVHKLSAGKPLPFRRMECEAGQEAQIDFGTGAMVVDAQGRRRRTHVLRVVLSHSRKAYSEAVWRQTTDEFIRVLENAFWHFGGVPRTLVPDNLKAAVLQADWYDPELSPKLRSFAQHYHTAVLPTKPYTPRHKGKVENGVGYVKDNALKGRQFKSLEEQNAHLLNWETQVADQRLHGTTRKQVGKVFAEAEKPALLPLPPDRFACFQEGKRSVHRDAHVEVAKAYYSVPPEYLGHEVWVRWDGRMVRIFNEQMREISLHVQKQPGQFSTLQEHLAKEKINGVERGAAWLLEKASLIGPQSTAWAKAMLQERGIEGLRVLMGLIALGKQHPRPSVEHACEVALSHGAFALRTLRQLIRRERSTGKQEQFEFAKEHEIIRPLSDYGQFTAW
jgi:transposase